jgi:hypothetical protein
MQQMGDGIFEINNPHLCKWPLHWFILIKLLFYWICKLSNTEIYIDKDQDCSADWSIVTVLTAPWLDIRQPLIKQMIFLYSTCTVSTTEVCFRQSSRLHCQLKHSNLSHCTLAVCKVTTSNVIDCYNVVDIIMTSEQTLGFDVYISHRSKGPLICHPCQQNDSNPRKGSRL